MEKEAAPLRLKRRGFSQELLVFDEKMERIGHHCGKIFADKQNPYLDTKIISS